MPRPNEKIPQKVTNFFLKGFYCCFSPPPPKSSNGQKTPAGNSPPPKDIQFPCSKNIDWRHNGGEPYSENSYREIVYGENPLWKISIEKTFRSSPQATTNFAFLFLVNITQT